MRKTRTILTAVATLLALALLAGCGGTTTSATTGASTTGSATSAATSAGTSAAGTTAGTDMVATASIVNTPEAFEKAISKDGTWIIATLKDLTLTRDLVLEGDFKNGRKDAAGADVYQRKIGPYTQDANRNVTARFTITAPRLTINSRNPSFEHGTFKGDIYVAVPNFKLIDATVNGNVYFKTQEIKSSFTMDATSKITGVQEVKAF